MDDEILELNLKIDGWISLLNRYRETKDDVRDIRNEDDKYIAYRYLLDAEECLDEALENLSCLSEFEYD